MSLSRNKRTKKESKRTSGYRVVSESYPSGRGFYFGEGLDDDFVRACTRAAIVGEFDTLSEAEQAAKYMRDATCQFEDCAVEYRDNRPIRYHFVSPDEDEAIDIWIVNIAEEHANKENVDKENAPRKGHPTAQPKRSQKAGAKTQERKFGPVRVKCNPDTEIFLRYPCRLSGGESHPPEAYGCGGRGKDSHSYMVQRMSDRNYAMRSLCLEGAGAKYTTFKRNGHTTHATAWLPSSNLSNHAEDETILDACHLDLVNVTNGKSLLTAETLLDAASPEVECMFLNVYQGGSKSPKEIATAIAACPNLKCFSSVESVISNDVLKALEGCTDLRGLLIEMPVNKSPRATDKALARVFKACSKLSWIYVDFNIFASESWMALAMGACPNLEVLWVNSTKSKNGRVGVARGDVVIIRTFLELRQSSLKLCMINPDETLKSRHVRMGAKQMDRLEGTKIEAPRYEDSLDYEEEQYVDVDCTTS